MILILLIWKHQLPAQKALLSVDAISVPLSANWLFYPLVDICRNYLSAKREKLSSSASGK